MLSTNLYAQRVCLVLSGGGAKGLYHIGIIKALEENEIPIDYISGTSMGSIVAGLYASGYTTEEMEELFTSSEVNNWVTGKMPTEYEYYYKKMSERPSMFKIDIHLNNTQGKDSLKQRRKNNVNINNPILPSSIVSSAQLDATIMSLTANVSHIAQVSFDSLFVPYRCLSVDINNHEPYVWEKGDLGLAIRSSMSIPIVFRPIKVDSMVMYDGGLMNNFPWQPMEEKLAPDLYIGGKCVNGNPDPNTIAGQIEMLIMNKTDYDLPKDRSIMIERDVDIGMLDFSKAKETIDQGYKDAMEKIAEIKDRIIRRTPIAEIDKRRLEFRKNLPMLVFDSVRLHGLTEDQHRYITSQFNSIGIKNKISYNTFKQEYYDILNDDIVNSRYPLATYQDSTGTFALDLHMTTKPGLKLLLGLDISSTAINQGYLGLQYKSANKINRIYTFDGYFGTFHSGTQLSMRNNYYRKRAMYTELSLAFNYFDYARGNSQRFSYKYESISHLKQKDAYASALIGYGIGKDTKFEIRLASGIDNYSYFIYDALEISDDITPDKSSIFFATPHVSIEKNTLNHPTYPTRGSYQYLSAYGVYIKEGYTPSSFTEITGDYIDQKTTRAWLGAKTKVEYYNNINKHFTIGYSAEGLYSNQPDLHNSYIDKLVSPGFYPNPLSRTLYLPSFRSTSYIATSIKPIVEFSEKFFLKSEFYGYLSDISNWNAIKNRLRYVVSSSIVYTLPFGLVSFNYSHFDDDVITQDYFILNLGFSIFNKKGIIY